MSWTCAFYGSSSQPLDYAGLRLRCMVDHHRMLFVAAVELHHLPRDLLTRARYRLPMLILLIL